MTESPPSIYIASSFDQIERIRHVYNAVTEWGFAVPDVWWNEDFKDIDVSEPEWYGLPEVHDIAARHWANIRKSDFFILVAPEEEPKSFTGANIELGYALAHNIPCAVYGVLSRSAMYVPVFKHAVGEIADYRLRQWLDYHTPRFYRKEQPQ